MLSLTFLFSEGTTTQFLIRWRRLSMKVGKEYFDPFENMSPKERLDRFVELLAIGSVKLLASKKIVMTSPMDLDPMPNWDRIRGRFRFGRTIEDKNMIKRIVELGGQTLSTGKIAKALNVEDHSSSSQVKWDRSAVWRILKCIKEKGLEK